MGGQPSWGDYPPASPPNYVQPGYPPQGNQPGYYPQSGQPGYPARAA